MKFYTDWNGIVHMIPFPPCSYDEVLKFFYGLNYKTESSPNSNSKPDQSDKG